MVDFVPNAATYSLGLSISHRNGRLFGNPHNATHIRLTIGMPNEDFADRLERQFRKVKDDGGKAVFSGETVTLNKCDVSVILPPIVSKIEVGAASISLVFDTAEQVKTWRGYSRIWSPKPVLNNTRLVIKYKWPHLALAKVVDDSSE